jgi:hypothetical protein
MRGPAAPLPPGTAFPSMDFADWRTGSPAVVRPSDIPTAIILVRSGCSYCKDQLTTMSASFDSIHTARYVFVTGEPSPPGDYPARWPRLLGRDASVAWVRAPVAQLTSAFKTSATPSTFIYGRDGRLVRSFRGLTGVGAIARTISAARGDSMFARPSH